jgi:hypothetical protein
MAKNAGSRGNRFRLAFERLPLNTGRFSLFFFLSSRKDPAFAYTHWPLFAHVPSYSLLTFIDVSQLLRQSLNEL